MASYARAFPDLAQELARSIRGELPPGWDANIPIFPADAKGLATRVASGQVMNAIAPRLPALIGGSADLDPSTHTALKGLGDFGPHRREAGIQGSAGGGVSFAGRNIHFGVREHAMGAITNGLAAHGGTLPYGVHLSDLLRLHAAADQAGGAHEAARHSRVHPRQHRARGGWPHASTGRAAGGAARDPECDRDQARRRQRNRGRMASGVRDARPSGRARADPAVGAHARSRPLRVGRWAAARRVRPGRCAGGSPS